MASSTSRPGQGHRERAADHHHGQLQPVQGRGRQDGEGQAERHESEDRKRKDQVEARNTADTIIYQAEKILRDQGDKGS
jgi:molecular chaperone DnaK (HSP70)